MNISLTKRTLKRLRVSITSAFFVCLIFYSDNYFLGRLDRGCGAHYRPRVVKYVSGVQNGPDHGPALPPKSPPTFIKTKRPILPSKSSVAC